MGFFHTVWAVARKDLLMELRGKEMVSSIFIFATLTLLILNFALDMNRIDTRAAAAGAMWVAFLFAGSVTMNRSFMSEKENDCLAALTLAPVDHAAIFFGKLAANFILMTVAEAVIVPTLITLFNVNVMERPGWQALVILLGTLGFLTIGTLVAAMAVNLRARELLGPLLMLPVVSPVIIAAAQASAGLVNGAPIDELAVWFRILATFDVIYLVVAWMVFERLIED